MADFNLGRIRFVWKGAWQTSTAYVRDDVVSFGGSSYVCIEAHTSGSTFADNSAKFELMAEGATSTTTAGDLIYNDGSQETRLPVGTTGQALFVDANGLPVWAGIEEAAATYYVTTGGSDSNNGQTLNSAFKTIKHAVSQITGPANLFVKTGTFYEQLPLDIPEGVAVVGDGQRTTEIKPIYIVATGANVVATDGADTATTIIVQDAQTTGNEWQVGAVVTGTSISGTVTITGITADTPTAGFTTLAVSFTSQTVSSETITLTSDYRTETMFRLGDSSMLHKVLMTGLTGFAPNLSAPTDITQATVQGVYVALDPDSPILNKSPYVIECSCFSTQGVGAVVDGTVHASGNRSIVFHAYTMINDDGVGLWVNGSGKAEAVSCFTYFNWIGYTTTNGGKIRSLSGNNSYGTYGVVSTGSHPTETTNDGALYGEQLAIESISGTFGVGNTITSSGGATGTVTNVQQDKIYYLSTSGTFQAGETITDGGSGATATISAGGATGQKGFILVADGFSAEPLPGGSVSISGDSNFYIIQSVSGSYVDSSSVMTILLANEKVSPSANDATISIIYEYSQARLTGHDFLSIGTGSKADTNYPGTFNQAESQANEVVENFPGRVFYVSTDQDGNFRVGDYFKVDQATGRATLNASAFDLSGLTSLRLGAIGAQLGELVDEFSSDSTLSGNSNTAVPTEAAVRGYLTQVATNIVPVADNTQTLGTADNRWQELFVGPGSVNIGDVKISDVGGSFTVTKSDDAPTTLSVNEFDTGSIRYFQNNIIGVNSNEDIEITASGTGVVKINSVLAGPETFYIDPAAVGDNTGTVIVKGNLQVDGTTTTINSTTLTVDDLNLVIADGAADSSSADGAGITIDGADATITYQHSGTKFVINKPTDISGAITASGDGTLQTSDGAILTLKSTDTTLENTEVVGSIQFDTADANDAGVAAKIEANAENASGEVGLNFHTGKASALRQRLNINRDGNVSFYNTAGDTANLVWTASTGNLNVTGTITENGNIVSTVGKSIAMTMVFG